MQVLLRMLGEGSYQIECDGENVGVCAYDENGRVSAITVDKALRRRGIGKAALRALADIAFASAQTDQLTASADPALPEAVGVFLRAGFSPIGMDSGMLLLRLTRESYDAKRREVWLRDVYDAMAAYDGNNPHNIHHFIKVHSFARQIGLHERLDPNTQFVLEVAALTHDIGIKPAMEQTGACPGPLQEQLGPPIAEVMLTSLGLPAPVIRRVCFLIGHHHTTQNVAGIDWRILLEADFLVNMIEGKATQDGIDAFRDNVFRTAEGLRLIELVRPAKEYA